MSDQHDETTNGAGATAPGPDAPDATRRRFAAIGLAAPVILTLTSRRALAEVPFNCTPSGWAELNISIGASARTPGSCGGMSPGYWKNHPVSWSPLPFATLMPISPGDVSDQDKKKWGAGGTLFSAVFGQPITNGQGQQLSLMQVLWNAPGSLEFHTIAAYLNAASMGEMNYGLSAQRVIDIYVAVKVAGEYQVGPGLTLNAGTAQQYFENTYH